MEALIWRQLDEIPGLPEKQLIKCYGVALNIVKDINLISILISDSTATAQATLYVGSDVYEQLAVPAIGDSVVILGMPFIKELGAEKKQVLKIKLIRMSVLSLSEQPKLVKEIIEERRSRMQRSIPTAEIMRKREMKYKDNQFDQKREVEIRSCLMTVLFLVLDRNRDLNDYCFNPEMMAYHPLSKTLKNELQLSDSFFEMLVSHAIKTIAEHGLIHFRGMQTKEPFYIIQRTTIEALSQAVLNCISNRGTSGIRLQTIAKELNMRWSIITEHKYLVDTKFVQRIVNPLIEINQVYKNSDRMLFINTQ